MLHQDYYSLLEDAVTIRFGNIVPIFINRNDHRSFIGLLAGDGIGQLHVIRVIVFVLLGQRLTAAEVAVSTHTVALNGIIVFVFHGIFSSFHQIIEARNGVTIVVARREHAETQRRRNDRASLIIVITRVHVVVLRCRDTVEEVWRRIFLIIVPRCNLIRHVNEATHDFGGILCSAGDEHQLSLPHLIMVPIEHTLLCCILSGNDILLGITVDHNSCLELARESEVLIDAMLSKIEAVEDDVETVATRNLRIQGIGQTLGIVEDSVILTFSENSGSHLTIIINLQHFSFPPIFSLFIRIFSSAFQIDLSGHTAEDNIVLKREVRVCTIIHDTDLKVKTEKFTPLREVGDAHTGTVIQSGLHVCERILISGHILQRIDVTAFCKD
nr:MAG TPA: hypothetical protein [Caudoviricetes sp.]